MNQLTKEIKGEVKSVVKIACIPTVAPYLLPLFLVDFAQKHPEIKIEVNEFTTGEIIRQLKKRTLDIGIISTPIGEQDLNEHSLYEEPFVLYDFKNRAIQASAIDEISMVNFWLMEEGHCLRDQVLDICTQSNSAINSSLNINFKASSIDSLRQFVKANKGQTLLPQLVVNNLTDNEQDHIINFNKPVLKRTIGLLTHQCFSKKEILSMLQQTISKNLQSIKFVKLMILLNNFINTSLILVSFSKIPAYEKSCLPRFF